MTVSLPMLSFQMKTSIAESGNWKGITICGNTRTQKCFWMKMEHDFNQDMKDFFVPDLDSFHSSCGVFDDDKLHCNWGGKNTKVRALKKVDHTGDKRHAFAIHTAQHSQ